MKEVGETLKKYRERANMSQQELSDKTGLRQSFISNIEKGTRPRVSFVTILTLANAINCPISVLSKELSEQDIAVLDTVRKMSESLKKE